VHSLDLDTNPNFSTNCIEIQISGKNLSRLFSAFGSSGCGSLPAVQKGIRASAGGH